MKQSVFFLAVAVTFSSGALARTEPYDPYAAVKYARDWALSRNTAVYPSFSADCTNFVSQALKAGGWRNTATNTPSSDQRWYYVNKTTYSQTWSVANGLYNRFYNGYEGWTKVYSPMTDGYYGDIVFADWQGDGKIDHVMLITGFRKIGETIHPVFTYHTTDVKDLPRPDFLARVKPTYPNVKYHRFSIQGDICSVPKSDQYV